MEVRDIMTRHVISVGQDEPVTAAVRLFRNYNLGAVPVTDTLGRLRGMLTDRDVVLRCFGADMDPARTRISEVMSRGIVTAAAGDSIDKAAEIMAKDRVRRLPVTENGCLVGMVSVCDMARSGECRAEFTRAMESISGSLARG